MGLRARYQLERLLGRGGMGQVWLARHHRHALPVAVKVLDGTVSPRHVRLLQAELRHTAALDHPNIVPVLDQGVLDPDEAAALGSPAGAPWLALGYVAGGDLDPRRGTFAWATARELALQLLDALAHAHGRGVLHLDVKPSNVLADGARPADRPRWLLADFGIASRLRDVNQARGGSAGFMAPEQLDPSLGPIGPWSDLYALGCTLRHLLADDALPADAVPWFEGLLAPVPTGRLTAADVRLGLLAIRGDGVPSTPPRAAPAPPPEPTVLAAELGATFIASPVAPRSPIPLPPTWRRSAPDATVRGPPVALVGLRTVAVGGRDAELDRLWDALLGAAADGRPRALVLEGPPDADPAAIARAFLARAVECGVQPAVHASLAPDTDGELLSELVTRTRGAGADDPLGALLPTAGPRPWLVLLEDADLGGLALARRALGLDSPLVFVAVARDADGWTGVERIRVGPLSPEGARGWLKDQLGLGRVLAYALVERHGPWPGLLAAAVRALWAAERLVETYDGHELAPGDSLGDPGASGDLDDVLARARTLVMSADGAAAEHLLAEHEARAPDRDRLTRSSLRAQLLWHVRRPAEADAAAADALAHATPGARDDDVAEACRIRGAYALDRGDLDGALAFLHQGTASAKTRGRRARLAYHLGNALLRRRPNREDHVEIRRIYTDALADAAGYDGLRSDILVQLAAAAREAGDPAAAHAHLDAAEAIRPDFGALVLFRAVLLRDEGRHEAAIAECRRAVRCYEAVGRSPYHPWLCEGLSRWALGQPADARTAFAEGLTRAAAGGRVAAEGALHAVSLAPALAEGDLAAAAAHLERAEATLAGAGESDRDLLAMLEDAAALAAGRAPALVPRIDALAADQRRLLAS